MIEPDLELKRWTRAEYEQLVAQGVFMPDDRVELIDGLLIVAEPQSAYHYTAVGLVARALAHAFGPEWDIRTQGPVALDDTSEPEPDVDDLLDRFLVIGTPDTVIRQITRIRELVGISHFNCSFWFGDIEHPRILKSMELFAREVMPAFR